MTYSSRSWRPVILGRKGAVAANHPLATQAGLMVLRDGGNAVDATIAIAMVLGVVEPHMSGLGGDGYYQLHDAASQRTRVYNGTGPAPIAATQDRYRDGFPIDGPLSFSTPGTVASLAQMHAVKGRLPWKTLLAPAIELARDGFGASPTYRYYADEQKLRLGRDKRSAAIFLRAGEAPALGTPIVQIDLSRTLEQLAEEGPNSFYHGAIARALAAGCAEVGALVGFQDLDAFEPEIQDPIAIRYRDFTLLQAPPNSTGWVLLQELKIAEQFDLKSMGALSPELVHTLVEAKKLAFADRESFAGDPRFVDAPIEHLLSDANAAARAALIDPHWAASLPLPPSRQSDTTYFCVVDGEGNAVSAIQSLNAIFGAGVIAGDTGILLNSRMSVWHNDPGHANEMFPGRRVRHTMNTPMVFRDGRLWAVAGTPGGDFQVQVNLQILTSMMEFGADPQQAAEAPRWSSTQPGQHAEHPHDAPDALNLESRFPAETFSGLGARGHNLVQIGDLDGPCAVEIIRKDADTGMLLCGSDPRRDGWALAY